MPDIPGFISATDAVTELRKYFMDDGPGREAKQNELLDQILRSVWNARGTADIATYDPYLHGVITPGIRALDR